MSDYNGWPNRETWNVALWASNDEHAYLHIVAGKPYTAAKAERVALELWPKGTPDMSGPEDMDAVDWACIAEAWNEE